jgi:hypothetical protein
MRESIAPKCSATGFSLPNGANSFYVILELITKSNHFQGKFLDHIGSTSWQSKAASLIKGTSTFWYPKENFCTPLIVCIQESRNASQHSIYIDAPLSTERGREILSEASPSSGSTAGARNINSAAITIDSRNSRRREVPFGHTVSGSDCRTEGSVDASADPLEIHAAIQGTFNEDVRDSLINDGHYEK